MVFFVSLRNKVGTDWPVYYYSYLFGTDKFELGYRLLNNLFGALGIHYNIFLFILNSTSLFLFYRSLKDYAIFFVISLLLFYSDLFLYLNFSGIRQAIAVSLVVYSIRFCLKKEFLYFIVCVLLASSFHITALIFMVAYFIPKRKFHKKEMFLFAIFFVYLSTIVLSITKFLDGDLAYRANFYLEIQENDPNLRFLYFVGAIKRSIILAMILIFGDKVLATENGSYFFNLYIIGFGIYLSTYLIAPDIGVRAGSYFLIFEIFLAGNLLLCSKNLMTRLFIITIFSFQALYKITTYMSDEYYQYNTIFG
tara:strand:- start:6134 stop:7057 length:924 start_codon:yes stop_codon:yes gene_type:complete